MLAGLSVVCFRQCPWYLKCVVMYARYKFCGYMRWAAEAELLLLLWDWSIFGGKVLLTPGLVGEFLRHRCRRAASSPCVRHLTCLPV